MSIIHENLISDSNHLPAIRWNNTTHSIWFSISPYAIQVGYGILKLFSAWMIGWHLDKMCRIIWFWKTCWNCCLRYCTFWEIKTLQRNQMLSFIMDDTDNSLILFFIYNSFIYYLSEWQYLGMWIKFSDLTYDKTHGSAKIIMICKLRDPKWEFVKKK